MKQITAIFGGTLERERERERVRPGSKIVPIFLALFFAVSVPPAVAGDDDDCVSIPETAGFPYKGQRHCCNLVESNLPPAAHNAKYGDIIPWDKNKGTVKKCLGGMLHDDKWSDEFVSISSTAHEFDEYDFVQKYKLMNYSKFNDTSGKWSTPSRRIDSVRYCVPNIGNSVKGKTFCDIRTNVLYGAWYGKYLFHTNMNEIRGCDPLQDPDYDEKEFGKYISKTTGYPVKIYPNGTVTKSFYATDENGYDTGAYVCQSKYWTAYGFCKESLGKHKLSIENTYSFNSQIVEGGADDGYHDCLLLTEDRVQGTQPAAEQNIDAAAESEGETTTESEESLSETGIQYDYQQCESDSDCTREKLSDYLNGNPYLHSTEWYCIEQSAGNKVCASKACENGYHIAKYANGNSKGFCEKDAPVQPNANAGQSGQSGANGSAGSANANSHSNKIVVTEQHDTDKKLEEIKKLTEKINKTYTELQGLTKNLSEWKTSEGKFNTARLASDSTAAVVLGTVGGVVTAKLVKKSQVKKGFESLQCYIGGQPIAAYGDEVTIGR